MFDAIKTILWRDLSLYYRSKGEWLSPLLFFVIVISLFPMALGPEPSRLSWASAGIIWVAAILATLLSLDRIFRSDYEDGIVDQLVLSPYPLPALVLAKALTHWIAIGLPLSILSPLLGILLGIPTEVLLALSLTLLLGTPTLSLVGSIGVALTVALRRGGMLLAVIVLPLYVPILVFGSSGLLSAMNGTPFLGHLALLGAMLIVALLLAPVAVAAALRVSIS